MSKGYNKVQPAKKGSAKKNASSRPSLLLALTLVPMVIGGLLILAWGLDIDIWDPPEVQVWIGILFILLSFAASNALQQKWLPAAGWLLLGVADFLLLRWLALWVQVIALVMATAGIVLILFEFIRNWRSNSKSKTKK